MDWYFNRKIPQSTSKRIILRPMSKQPYLDCKTFVNGIAKCYDDRYDPILVPYINLYDYNLMMNRINDNLISMWPCGFCLLFGYCLSPCTLGLSLGCPLCCIWQATSELQNDINEINKIRLNAKGLNMSLQRGCCTSWLQIDITDSPTQSKKDLKDDEKNSIEANLLK